MAVHPETDPDNTMIDVVIALGNYIHATGDDDPEISKLVSRLNGNIWRLRGDPIDESGDAEPVPVQIARRVLRRTPEQQLITTTGKSAVPGSDMHHARSWYGVTASFFLVLCGTTWTMATKPTVAALITFVGAIAGAVITSVAGRRASMAAGVVSS